MLLTEMMNFTERYLSKLRPMTAEEASQYIILSSDATDAKKDGIQDLTRFSRMFLHADDDDEEEELDDDDDDDKDEDEEDIQVDLGLDLEEDDLDGFEIETTGHLVSFSYMFFKHNFCVKSYVPRETRRNPSNRRLHEHGKYIRHCQASNSQQNGSRYH